MLTGVIENLLKDKVRGTAKVKDNIEYALKTKGSKNYISYNDTKTKNIKSLFVTIIHQINNGYIYVKSSNLLENKITNPDTDKLYYKHGKNYIGNKELTHTTVYNTCFSSLKKPTNKDPKGPYYKQGLYMPFRYKNMANYIKRTDKSINYQLILDGIKQGENATLLSRFQEILQKGTKKTRDLLFKSKVNNNIISIKDTGFAEYLHFLVFVNAETSRHTEWNYLARFYLELIQRNVLKLEKISDDNSVLDGGVDIGYVPKTHRAVSVWNAWKKGTFTDWLNNVTLRERDKLGQTLATIKSRLFHILIVYSTYQYIKGCYDLGESNADKYKKLTKYKKANTPTELETHFGNTTIFKSWILSTCGLESLLKHIPINLPPPPPEPEPKPEQAKKKKKKV